MQKGISLILATILFVSVSASVVAQDASPSASPASNARLEEIRAARKKTVEAAQKRREEALAKSETRREALKEKIATIRDENKQKIITHLDEVMNAQNERWVNHWNNVLTKLSEIVVKLEARGAETAEAKAAIAKAQAAVTAQGTQVYAITITDESKLRTDVAPVAQDFKADLRATQAEVKLAREAVHAAFKTIEKQDEEGNEPTPSAE
jgi:hypothetical protein